VNVRCDDVVALAARVDAGPELLAPPPPVACGRLLRSVGLTLEAVGLHVGIGARCLVEDGPRSVQAEVVGFNERGVLLMPLGELTGIAPQALVRPVASRQPLPSWRHALGRVLDGLGEPLDGGGDVQRETDIEAMAARNPLSPHLIEQPLDVGVRVLNAMLPVGRGQRMGLFAGSGVGKSVLLGMMSRYTDADIAIVALVGERGREVKDFIAHNLGSAGRQRTVVVAAPASDPPLKRLRCAELAMSLAERARAAGRHVLLLMDSLTRYAQAQREIALATGEPPATKGYTPSVFALLPRLVERAGNGGDGEGSITAFFTVLAEGDDQQDPIADAARAVLDGHVVLSRALAEQGHYPAVDVEASISRLEDRLLAPPARAAAQELRRLLSRHRHNEDLIAVGAYVPGSDRDTDRALALMPQIRAFLRQRDDERCDRESAQGALLALLATAAPGTQPEPAPAAPVASRGAPLAAAATVPAAPAAIARPLA
jgi:flagellum-specific ATP synthase